MNLADNVQEMMEEYSKEVLFEKFKDLLDAVKTPETIKDIPKMLIHDFRDLSVEESEKITGLLKVKTIRELSKVTYKQLADRINLIIEAGIPKEKLELLITAAKYITKAAEAKPIEGLTKIVIAGLDNAGKTALLKSIKKEVAFTELSALKPTKGASREGLLLSDQEFLLLELGGQEEFRKFYIEQPDRFFLETDCIVYLIDIQDDERYSETIEYLQQILRTLKYLQEAPDFIILFHKCDPDVIKNPIFQEKIDYMNGKIKETFKEFPFRFEVQTSSIYNVVSMTPSFSRMLKGLFSGVSIEDEEKLQSIGTLLTKVVDSFLGMETTLNRQIYNIKTRLDKIEAQISNSTITPTTKATSATQQADSTAESTPKPSEPRGGLSTRAALLQELKQVFGLRGKVD